MPGDSRGDFLVGGVLLLAAHVPGSGRDHARQLVEGLLGAPEAARGKGRFFELLLCKHRQRDAQDKNDQTDLLHFPNSSRTASMTDWSRRHSRTLRSGELRTAAK